MIENDQQLARTRTALNRVDLATLAERAIAALAQEREGAKIHDPHRMVTALSEVCVLSDENDFNRKIAQLRAEGLTSSDLVQQVIPDTARLLGEHWLDDRLTFAEVTIGARRLQHAVYEAMRITPVAAPNLVLQAQGAMIVPVGEDHMIGASVACHAFEQRGVRMRLIVGLEEEPLAKMLRLSGFAFVGFSVSSEKSVDLTLSLVEKLSTAHDIQVPMVIGGSASDALHLSPGIADASLVSSDPDAVIDAMNIRALAAPGK